MEKEPRPYSLEQAQEEAKQLKEKVEKGKAKTYDEAERKLREEQFQSRVEELKKVTDRLGMPIDKNILETIAGLNLLGIPTSSSCGGHLKSEEGNLGFPYFGGHTPNEPRIRFRGEIGLRDKIAAKYGVDPKQVADDEKSLHEYWDTIQNEDYKETEEYQKWMAENENIKTKVAKLLEDFYQNRAPGKARLRLGKIYPGYRVETIDGAEIEELKKQEIPEDEMTARLEEQIRAAQKEMAEFTEFVKQRFANS
jgi:hypothetical protein